MMPSTRCACDETHTVLVEVRGVYDGALHFHCTACRADWHRFPAGDWRHDKANALVGCAWCLEGPDADHTACRRIAGGGA